MTSSGTDFIGIDITGVEEIAAALRELYPEAADAGVELSNEYMLDVERANARLPYANEPFAWSSDKQRRKVFALLREEGGPPYARTQTLSRGWKLLGYGQNQILVNEVPYAKWVKDIAYQTVGMFRRDWTVTAQDIQERMDQIIRKFEAGVDNAIKKLGLE